MGTAFVLYGDMVDWGHGYRCWLVNSNGDISAVTPPNHGPSVATANVI
jgi:hypothetical protein